VCGRRFAVRLCQARRFRLQFFCGVRLISQTASKVGRPRGCCFLLRLFVLRR
jgi:hypothetical protein